MVFSSFSIVIVSVSPSNLHKRRLVVPLKVVPESVLSKLVQVVLVLLMIRYDVRSSCRRSQCHAIACGGAAVQRRHIAHVMRSRWGRVYGDAGGHFLGHLDTLLVGV